MSDGRDLAKETATLCVACLSLVWVPPVAAAIVPLVALAALGRDLWGKCPERVTAAAIESVFAGMGRANLPPARITAAREALAALPATAQLDPATLVAAAKSDEGFDAAVLVAILAHLPASTAFETRSLIETALATGLRTCRAHPGFRATLTEALVLDTARGVGLLQQGVARIETRIDALPEQLLALLREQGLVGAGAKDVSADQLRKLALKFEETDLNDPAALITFLDMKAQEYHAYRTQIDAIDERTAGLGNLKAAAKDAADRLDFAEVENLLSRVDEVETTIAAETKELRADTALMRGRVHDAFTHLSAAADSFAGIDPVEPGRRRVDYAERLRQHGLRYGGPGLGLAARMHRDALSRIDRGAQPELWAAAQNDRGNALNDQGTCTGGAEGAALLADAIAAYRAALQVYTHEAHPVDWAMTQNNLANAFGDQGTCTGGAEGAALLADAIAAYRAALQVYTHEAHPVDWAMTQNNLGNALRDQGNRTGGAEGAALLADAIAAYRAALQVYTHDAHPVDWAMTQNNLGNALRDQGNRTGGAEGAALLADAVAAYRAALQVRTRDAYPVGWAMTQNNLGNALRNQGNRTGGAAGAALLGEAVAAYRAALQVYTRDAHPVNWAMTQNNLGAALRSQGSRTDGAEGAALLGQAVAAYRAALQVRSRDAHPVDWAMTQENIALTELSLADHDTCADPLPPLRAALAHVDSALTIFDPVHMAFNHTKANALRARILTRLRDLGEGA